MTDANSVRVLRIVVFVQAAVILLLGAGLALFVPRALTADVLFDENLALRERIARLDRKMDEVDRILLRLRLYEAQLDSLRPTGEHGPLPPGDQLPAESPDPDAPDASLPFRAIPQPVQPADAWADEVITRAESFLDVFDEAEADLNAVVTELEDLRALDRALPGRWPTTGDLTSGFGFRRSPFGRRTLFHHGIDISDSRGTPIVSVAPGTVIRATYNGGYGRFVEVDHGYGITTRYGHMHRLLVREGDTVEAGTLVGTMGRTGRATGTHLHFEVRIDGHAVDPLEFLPAP